jgi:hypothetical protein
MDPESPATENDVQARGPSGGFVRQGDVWCEVTEIGHQTFRVRVGGELRSAWMATLCVGLADRRLSIHQAHARRGPDGLWMAELTVIALAGAPDPRHVPYIELATAEVKHVPGTLKLDACTAIESRDHGGSLLLELQGEDTLGLLGSVLASLATLMLFPIEMHIETRAGRAYDALWLAGMGGHAPSPRATEALQRLVRSWKRASLVP